MKVWTIKSTESGWYVADANRDFDQVLSANGLEEYEIIESEIVEYDDSMKQLLEETV